MEEALSSHEGDESEENATRRAEVMGKGNIIKRRLASAIRME